MSFDAPPIVKQAERVMREVEVAVRHFARYHKYSVGADLRDGARDVARLTHRAWRDSGRKSEWIDALVFAVDDLKLTLQLAKELQAFRSFSQFEGLARLVSDLGRQCGGWQRQRRQGQDGRTSSSAQRSQRLSACDASSEARS